ncbi:hypothetical protein D3C76_1017730 [compost metagenome]
MLILEASVNAVEAAKGSSFLPDFTSSARIAITAISSRVIDAFGAKILLLRPLTIPSLVAAATYEAYHASDLMSVNRTCPSAFKPSARTSSAVNSARLTLLFGSNSEVVTPDTICLAASD